MGGGGLVCSFSSRQVDRSSTVVSGQLVGDLSTGRSCLGLGLNHL